jgi:hypothetical protein
MKPPLPSQKKTKKKIEIIPCEQALALTLLDGLRQSNYQQALQGLCHQQENAHYTHEQLRLSLVLLSAWGVLRLSHISDQPVEPWGVLLDKPRRPDGDTLDRLLNQIIEWDEVDSVVEQRLGQIRPGGIIDLAQQTSFRYWVEAGLTEGDIWYFDDHVTEYTGQAQIGKTKHGTKQISVKSITRYTLHKGLCSLSEYFPVTVSYGEAMRHLVSKANACLPAESRIGKLAFDRAGWDADLLTWLQETAGIVPVTWVKRTNSNVKRLNAVNDDEFVAIDTALALGKTDRQHIVNVADTTLDFPQLGQQRVVILATNEQKRIAIYTTAPFPGDVPLADEQGMGTVSLIDAMRYKQRIENRFKVEVNEMDSDALPTHKTYSASLTEPYDLDRAQKQLDNAQRRLDKYTVLEQEQQQLYEENQLDKHQLNLLSQRSQRLRHKANREIETLSHEIAHVAYDQDEQPLLSRPTEVLDVRKLTLLNLFKLHALVALKILARRLGLPEAGPERLRRSFLAFGDRVEFDHDQQIATVYARPFPRGPMQEAYERLCSELHDVPIELMHNGLTYRVRFSW